MSDFEKLQETVYQLLKLVGENPDREGLLDTPKRVAKMYQEVFSGRCIYDKAEASFRNRADAGNG